MPNRKVLVSVFSPQEAREAVLGGARIVDSEDPRSALGTIKPRQIMAISDSVLNHARGLDVQLSTNIGEDQLLFKRAADGRALQKSPYEIAGKAAQAALGVTVAMGHRVHPCPIVKVGLDGMDVGVLTDVLTEVVATLDRTEAHCHTQVMSVLFAQDLDLWAARRTLPGVRRALVALREFHPADAGPGVFDLCGYAVGTLRDADGKVLFTDPGQVDLDSLKDKGVLPEDATHTRVALTELYPHSRFGLGSGRRTDREAIRRMVDATARAGADAMMLDTSVLLKVARVGLVSAADSPDLVAFEPLDVDAAGLDRRGVLSVADIRFFVDYCHHRGLEANLAGSITSYQAQQLWRLVPHADHVSTRGGASAVQVDPAAPTGGGEDSRLANVIRRDLVRGYVPPEQNGHMCLPEKAKGSAGPLVADLRHRYPDLPLYWADREGRLTEV
ncbi:(5-formylfuran-3-yl)methyl phosphate synthase [Longispora urticae]